MFLNVLVGSLERDVEHVCIRSDGTLEDRRIISEQHPPARVGSQAKTTELVRKEACRDLTKLNLVRLGEIGKPRSVSRSSIS